jgi:hypothetical protein
MGIARKVDFVLQHEKFLFFHSEAYTPMILFREDDQIMREFLVVWLVTHTGQ